jgi:hypothetical protein
MVVAWWYGATFYIMVHQHHAYLKDPTSVDKTGFIAQAHAKGEKTNHKDS